MYKQILTVSALALCSFGANAESISITSQNYVGNAPLAGTPAPASTTGLFENTTGSILNATLSPYAFNTGLGSDGSAAAIGAQYSVLNLGGSISPATAIYNVNGADNFVLVWGSPDTYNEVRFYSGPNGTGSLINVTGGENTFYTGADLGCYGTTCTQTLFDLLTFTDVGGLIGSVSLTDTGTAAFEYAILADPPSNTPLPATLPMFAGGLGLFWWMKRRSNGSKRCEKHLRWPNPLLHF